MSSPEFDRSWAGRRRRTAGPGWVTLVGELYVFDEVLRAPDSGQLVATFCAEPGSASATGPQLLARLVADAGITSPSPHRVR